MKPLKVPDHKVHWEDSLLARFHILKRKLPPNTFHPHHTGWRLCRSGRAWCSGPRGRRSDLVGRNRGPGDSGLGRLH